MKRYPEDMNSTKMGHKTFRVICYSADFLNENIKESVLNFCSKEQHVHTQHTVLHCIYKGIDLSAFSLHEVYISDLEFLFASKMLI